MLKQSLRGLALALAAVATVLAALLTSLEEGSWTALHAPSSTAPVPKVPGCVAPIGWALYEVRLGETLPLLAAHTRLSVEQLLAANCLSDSSLAQGDWIFLPPGSTSAEATPCSPPPGWSLVALGENESLAVLAARLGTSETFLLQANCLDLSTLPQPGSRLFVPP